jgi:hypothetical protein
MFGCPGAGVLPGVFQLVWFPLSKLVWFVGGYEPEVVFASENGVPVLLP